MKKLLFILSLFILVSQNVNSQLAAHAGGTITIDVSKKIVRLDASGSTGLITSYTWTQVSPFPNQPTNMRLERTDQVKPWVKTLVVGTWKYKLSVTDGVTTSNDTATVIVQYNNPPPQSTGNFIATASDTAALNANAIAVGIPLNERVKVGDYIITGANDQRIGVGNTNLDIYDSGLLHTVFTSKQKICINASGNPYGTIGIVFSLTQLNNVISNDQDSNKVQIVGYNGVLRTHLVNFTNPKNIWFNGEYITGSGWAGGYAYRYNKFGIIIDNGWQNMGAATIGISGYADSVSISGVQAGNGTFTTLFCKQHAVDSAHIYNIYRGFHLRRNFFVQSHGEGIYIGDTDADSLVTFDGTGHRLPTIYQHLIQGMDISENVFAFNGNEGIQVGDGVKNIIRHNTVWLASINNFSTFDESQDQPIQLDYRNGGNRFDSNLVHAAGRYFVNLFIQSKHREGGNGAFNLDSNVLANNGFFAPAGDYGSFGIGRDSLAQQHTIFKGNYMGFANFNNDQIYLLPDSRAVNKQIWFRTDDPSNNNFFSFRNNVIDNTKTAAFTGDAKFDSSGNQKVTSIAYPVMTNTGFKQWGYADSTVARIAKTYVFRIFLEYGDEYANKRSNGVRQGDTVVYKTNDLVTHLGHWYRSRHNNNWGNMPYDADSTDWQVLYWTDPSTGLTVFEPPTDVRLVQGDFYQTKGMGISAFSATFFSGPIRYRKVRRKKW